MRILLLYLALGGVILFLIRVLDVTFGGAP